MNYDNSYISFNYPSNWNIETLSAPITSSNNDIKVIGLKNSQNSYSKVTVEIIFPVNQPIEDLIFRYGEEGTSSEDCRNISYNGLNGYYREYDEWAEVDYHIENTTTGIVEPIRLNVVEMYFLKEGRFYFIKYEFFDADDIKQINNTLKIK